MNMKIPIWMIALGVAGFAATGVGCSGGGDDDDDDDGGSGLQTGTYTASGAALVGTDECDLPDLYLYDPTVDLDGSQYEITAVTATEVTFQGANGPVPLPRSGNTIGGEAQVIYEQDWMDTATSGLTGQYNCVEEDRLTTTFTIVNDTTLGYEEFWTATSTAGSASDCIIANASAWNATLLAWPCETNVTADITHD